MCRRNPSGSDRNHFSFPEKAIKVFSPGLRQIMNVRVRVVIDGEKKYCDTPLIRSQPIVARRTAEQRCDG